MMSHLIFHLMFILLISTRFSLFPLIHNKSSLYRITLILYNIYFNTFRIFYLKYYINHLEPCIIKPYGHLEK